MSLVKVTCCAPLAAAALSLSDAETLALGFKALADPGRLRLLSLIQGGETGEACVCELTDPIGLSQGTVSHHLKVLLDAGLVEREKRGVWMYYRVVPDRVAALADVLR